MSLKKGDREMQERGLSKEFQSKKGMRYPVEIRSQAAEMYIKCRPEYSTNEQTASHVAKLLGVGHYDTVIK